MMQFGVLKINSWNSLNSNTIETLVLNLMNQWNNLDADKYLCYDFLARGKGAES